MNKNLIVSIVVIILAAGAGYWVWSQKDTDDWKEYFENRPPAYTDPAILKPGDPFGVFTVESVTKDENGDWQVQLTGEKVVRGRFFVARGPGEELDEGKVCFFTRETTAAGALLEDSIIPNYDRHENTSFCLRDVLPSEFEKNIPAENFHDYIYIKMRIADPIFFNVGGVSVRLLNILLINNTPQVPLTP